MTTPAPPQAGRKDRRIVVEQYIETRDAAGEPVKVWTTYATLWAKYLQNRGQERFVASQMTATATASFVVWWSTAAAEITPKMRVIFDGEYYDLLTVSEIGRHVELELFGRAQTPRQAAS